METENIIKLIDAGFTADEIREMIKPAANPAVSSSFSAAPLSPEPTAAEAEGSAAAEAPAEVIDISTMVKSAVADQFAAMLQENQESLNKIAKMVSMPSLDSVQPKSIDDIVTKFFKEE